MLIMAPDAPFRAGPVKDPTPHAEKIYRVPANRETRRTGVEVGMNGNAAQ